ncbi:hypothetical protein LTSEUGA_5533, partial [Salmonella enterica subsp. enterica serovar Uganda str. R8-3404]
MDAALRHLPDKPGIHRTEQQLATLRAFGEPSTWSRI